MLSGYLLLRDFSSLCLTWEPVYTGLLGFSRVLIYHLSFQCLQWGQPERAPRRCSALAEAQPEIRAHRGLSVVVAWLQCSWNRVRRQDPQGSPSSGRRGSGTGKGVARPLCCVTREPCHLGKVPTPALGFCG